MIIRQSKILALFIFISCASNPLSENINSWNSQKDDNFWYGTAIISKENFDGQNIHKPLYRLYLILQARLRLV